MWFWLTSLCRWHTRRPMKRTRRAGQGYTQSVQDVTITERHLNTQLDRISGHWRVLRPHSDNYETSSRFWCWFSAISLVQTIRMAGRGHTSQSSWCWYTIQRWWVGETIISFRSWSLFHFRVRNTLIKPSRLAVSELSRGAKPREIITCNDPLQAPLLAIANF